MSSSLRRAHTRRLAIRPRIALSWDAGRQQGACKLWLVWEQERNERVIQEKQSRPDSKERKPASLDVPKDVAIDTNARLHVGHLTRNVTTAHVREIFGTFGELKEVEVAVDRAVNLPRGFAYVEYKSHEDAEKARDHMDGGQLDGNLVTVQFGPTGPVAEVVPSAGRPRQAVTAKAFARPPARPVPKPCQARRAQPQPAAQTPRIAVARRTAAVPPCFPAPAAPLALAATQEVAGGASGSEPVAAAVGAPGSQRVAPLSPPPTEQQQQQPVVVHLLLHLLRHILAQQAQLTFAPARRLG
ncbi:SRS3 [Auxenochlorella protothecoides x Auxenochlorella symbiontica]